jgi:branched-chain amino acid aminotransferase
LRPLLFGSGAQLGVAASHSYTFCIFASPVGPYFKGGLKGIDLLVSDWHRAARKGSGSTKAIGNYAPVFKAQKEAKLNGFTEALFLDGAQDRYVEEAGASNFFALMKDGTLHTPELTGSILPGVTRESVINLARKLGVRVSERKLPIEEVFQAKEAFCTGTGAVITPVASVTQDGKKVVFGDGQVGALTKELYHILTGIQTERVPDEFGWLHDPYA